MSNYYVDLSASSNGVGTEPSPWNWTQFYSFVNDADDTNIVKGDVIYLKGMKNVTNAPSGDKYFKLSRDFQISMKSWDIVNFGPWRIYDSSNVIALNGVIEIEGGVVISDYKRNVEETSQIVPTIMLYSSAVETCFIKSERVSFRSFPESSANPFIYDILEYTRYCFHYYCGDVKRDFNVLGSTIISDNSLQKVLDVDFREPTSLLIKDSVVYINSLNFQEGKFPVIGFRTPLTAVSAECFWDIVPSTNFNTLKGTVNVTQNSNLQYGWNVPTIGWPSWSAEKDNFNYAILGTGITLTGSDDW